MPNVNALAMHQMPIHALSSYPSGISNNMRYTKKGVSPLYIIINLVVLRSIFLFGPNPPALRTAAKA